MASRLLLMPMRLGRYASAARLAAAYAASRAVRSGAGAGASDLALARYAARNPDRYVRLPSSAAAGARGPASGADHDSSSADQEQCKEEVIRSYERVDRVPFEAKEEDMESEEALWALYKRWCEHFKMERDHAEMLRRFDRFKFSVFNVHGVNNAGLSWKAELNKFADGKLLENMNSQSSKTRRIMFRHEWRKSRQQLPDFEQQWVDEVESKSATTTGPD